MPRPITQSDMEAVFAVTDDLGIHRESITVPLGKADPGEVRDLGGGQLRIVVPESPPAGEWAQSTLREELARLGFDI
jgi:hypothetical protein